MWGKLEHAIKDERATLEEDVAPVPPVILDDVVRFRLDPQVEHDKEESANPSMGYLGHRCLVERFDAPQSMNDGRQVGGHAEARERKHAVRGEVTAKNRKPRRCTETDS